MYTWIWRHQPGGTASRGRSSLLLAPVVSAVLLFVVFPGLEPMLPSTDVTVDPGSRQ